MSTRFKTVDIYLRVTYDNEYANHPRQWDWPALLQNNDIVVQAVAFTDLPTPDPRQYDALTRGLDLRDLPQRPE